MLSFDDARDRILAAAAPLSPENRRLADATGYHLASSITARLTKPPFAASAMDGYALASGSASDGQAFRIVGRSEAGNGFAGTVSAGEAVRIFTGAPVPAGTDTVIVQENAEPDGDSVRFTTKVEADQNIRTAGNDFVEGAPLLETGTALTPAAIALAAAAGHGELSVTRRPTVAILATGDELVPAGTLPGPDQIVASNGPGLTTLLAPYCAEVTDLGIAGDDMALLHARLGAALASDADVIVTTGGASVGDKDYVKPVLQELGITLDLWRIAMRPGKPLLFARAGNKLIFGLPGNPVSSLTTAQVLLIPALKALAGAPEPGPNYVTLPLASALRANGPRRHFHRARLENTPEGLRVAPLEETDSAHLSSFALADALVVHPEKSPALPEGSLVQVVLLG